MELLAVRRTQPSTKGPNFFNNPCPIATGVRADTGESPRATEDLPGPGHGLQAGIHESHSKPVPLFHCVRPSVGPLARV